MTDKADKVHPVVEAMARAIAEACGEPQAWVAHIEPAKAAAKVLLSMEPTQAMISACDPGPWSAAKVFRDMTAAARSEMGV